MNPCLDSAAAARLPSEDLFSALWAFAEQVNTHLETRRAKEEQQAAAAKAEALNKAPAPKHNCTANSRRFDMLDFP